MKIKIYSEYGDKEGTLFFEFIPFSLLPGKKESLSKKFWMCSYNTYSQARTLFEKYRSIELNLEDFDSFPYLLGTAKGKTFGPVRYPTTIRFTMLYSKRSCRLLIDDDGSESSVILTSGEVASLANAFSKIVEMKAELDKKVKD